MYLKHQVMSHEMCGKCHRWLALNQPHVKARTRDGLIVYLHIGFCASYYEMPLSEKEYVNYPDPAVYGGGS